MRKLLLAVVVWLTATAAFAQPILPGQKATLGVANATAIINTFNNTTLTVQVLGTWTGTLSFEGSLDGSTYTATNCTAINGTTAVTTTTSNGVWSCSVIGINALQTRFSSFGSGTAVVSYQTAYVAGGSGGGGGSGGNVSIIQGGNTAAVNGSSQLSVNCANCSGSGVSQQDNTGFVPGTTNFVPVGGEVDDVGTSAVAENSAGSARITPQRGLQVNLRTNAGVETGIAAAPLQVSLANTAANATAVKVDGSAVTQPVSGTVTVTDGAGALNVIVDSGTTAVTQGTAASLNATVVGTGTFAVQAAESGTWNITNVSGTVSLPTGASTAAKQPALGTAGSASADVISVQGIASMTPLLVTPSLPALASTSTKQSDGTQKTQIVDGSGNVIASTSNNLNVQCANCSGSGVSAADEATFTAGTSLFALGGGFFQTTATSNPLTNGQQGAFQLTANRAMFVNLRTSAGAEVVASTDATTNTTTQTTGPQLFANGSTATPTAAGADGRSIALWSTLNGSLHTTCDSGCSGGTQYTQDAALTVATSIGTMAMGRASAAAPSNVSADDDAVLPWYLRSGAQVTQPTFAGVLATTGNGASGTGVQRVTLANDSTGIVALTTGSAQIGHLEANQSSNIAQINGVTPLMGVGATGTGAQRVVPVANGTIGAAPPAQADYIAGIASGATGGFLAGFTACDFGVKINISTATTTLMITGVSGRVVHICNFHMITAAANNVAWVEGTGATCGTGTTGMAGGTTAASGYNFAANGGMTMGSGIGDVLTSGTTGDSVCLVTSAATQLSGFIRYTIY